MIVGYYCDHSDEPIGQRSHLSDNRYGKRRVGDLEANTTRALTFGVWDFKKQKNVPPPCPRAIPIRMTAARLAAMRATTINPIKEPPT